VSPYYLLFRSILSPDLVLDYYLSWMSLGFQNCDLSNDANEKEGPVVVDYSVHSRGGHHGIANQF
jgi:hypothetical protein